MTPTILRFKFSSRNFSPVLKLKKMKKNKFENYKNLFLKNEKSVAVTDGIVSTEIGAIGNADWLDLNTS